MNREEIMNMEAGRELDALVAEHVMGWKWEDGRGTGGPSYWEGATGEFCAEFEPSTDWAAAGEVVDALTKRRAPSNRLGVCLNCPPHGGWSVDIWAYDDHWRVWVEDDDELPLAICRAALLATLEAANAL